MRQFILISFLLVMAFAQALAGTYGLTFFDQGSSGCAGCATYLPGMDVQNLQQLTYSDSFNLTGLVSGYSSNLSASIGNGSLHGYTQVSIGNGGGQTYANLDEYFYDTFTISGPAGQSGQFQVNMLFDGSVTTNNLVGSVTNTFNLVENGTIIPGLQYTGIIDTLSIQPGTSSPQTLSVTLTLASGSTVTLGELLQIRDEFGNSCPATCATVSATVNDSDTGLFTVTPLTNGFNFTTASGLTYTQSAVPEPSSAVLFVSALLLGGIGFLRNRRRFRGSAHRIPTPANAAW